MRAAAVVCGAVLAIAVAPLAFGHGTNPDRHGYGPWAGIGRQVDPARAPGRELPRLRTARSQTFQRADGARITRVFQQSQFFRDRGRWARIDNRLKRSGNRFDNAGNRFDVSIPTRLSAGPLRITNGTRSLSFRLLGAADVTASVDGADATFRAVMPGVTARWSAANDSVKEELVLSRRSVSRVYRYDVAGTAGLAARTRADGGLEFIDSRGQAVFLVPAPFGYDAKGLEAPPGTVSLSARPGGSGWQVELRVKDAWLTNRRTAFPVTVDPTIEVPSTTGDCKLDGELTDESFCTASGLQVGWSEFGAFEHDHHSILKFDVDAALPPGATVTSATLRAYLDFAEPGASGKSIEVHRVTRSWTDDASWLNSAAGVPWTTPGGDFAPQIEAQTTIDDDDEWYAWPLTNLVSGWYGQTIANHGLMLKDDGAEVVGAAHFASTEAWPGNWPYLEIAYTGGAPEGPTHELTGGLRTPLSNDRSLDAKAIDEEDGVASVAVWLDPDLDPSNGEAAERVTDPCTSGCPDDLTADFTLPSALAQGRHTILVRSEDGAGGVTRDRWDFQVAALGSADRSRLGLEQWFQYDATPAGGDSNVYVNADTGNVIWHSVPIVNPGRGLSTVVNVTYNSHDHGGELGSTLGNLPVYDAGTGGLTADRLAPLSYSEAGKGVSISVSGPTRINEPLRGVLLAQAAEEGLEIAGLDVPSTPVGLKIAMTDADGTEHTFTNVAGKWVAPPGLNMRLRRFRSGGTIASPIPNKWALTRPDGVTHFFDNLGFLAETKDRNGNLLSYNYERVNAFDGAACGASDVIGTLVPGESPRLCARRLTSVVDPAGRVLTIEYEEGGFLATPLDGMLPELPVDQFAVIGGNSKIDTITDHAGREYKFEYDSDGYLVRFKEAANKDDVRVTSFTYEAGTPHLRNIGDDRYLDAVIEMRDQDDDGSIDPWDQDVRTSINYEDRPALPIGSDRDERLPYQVNKRSGARKYYAWEDDPHTLEVTEELNEHTGHTATTAVEVDDRGRPTTMTDPLETVTALTWSDDNKVTRLTRAQGTADESVTDYAYDTTNGTGVLESQTGYPSWPSTSGARTTDLVWAFGSGVYHADATEAASGHFVADLDQLQNPKPNTGWDFTFDERGNVTDREDARGNVAHTVYDGVGLITLERDEQGNEVVYDDFHPTGMPGRVIDERENSWFYKYDAVGNVTALVDPRGQDTPTGAEGNPYTTNLSYDSFDRLTREHVAKLSNPEDTKDDSESRFITRTHAFDRNGNVVVSVDGEGRETTIDYSAMDMPVKVTAPGSNGAEITRYVYDTADRLIGKIAPKGDGLTAPGEVFETHAEECSGEDPPLDFLTRFCLDDIGRLQAEIRYSSRAGDPNNLIGSFAWDRRDNIVGMVDPNRNQGRLAGVAIAAAANPSLQRMTYAYNKVDELTTDTEKPTEAGVAPTVSSYVYDANGNRTEIHHPRGDNIRTHLTYDHRDQLIAAEDPLGHLTCIQRRADGRVVAQTTPRGTAGNHGACTDGNPVTGYTHFTTKYTYDPAGNLASRSVPFAPNQYGRTDAQLSEWTVEYTRNAVGDPTTIKDARGNSFDNTFYDTGELRTTDRPSFYGIQGGLAVERTMRSANAERSSERDKRQSTRGQTDFGRVDPEPLPGLLPQAGPTRLVYDGEMRLTIVRDAAGDERKLSYDPAGRVTEQKWPFKANNPISNQFAYDKNGNVTSFTDGEGKVTTYAHDGYDRLAETTAPGAHPTDVGATALPEITRFRYDHNGNERFRETARGVATATAGDFTLETGYDSLDRVAFEQAPDGGRTSYAYDVASNLITETRPRGQGRSGEDLESFQTRMTYDNADRVTESRQQVTDGSDLVELPTTLEYDADGNLVKITEPGAKGAPDATLANRVTRRVHDGRGLLWKTTVGAVPASERTSLLEFDANGNLRRIVNPRGVDQDTENAEVVDSGADSNANLTAASENATVMRYDEADLLVSERLPWNSADERHFRRVFQRTDDDPDTDDRLRRVTSILSAHAIDDEGDPIPTRVARTSYSYYRSDWIRSISDQKLTDPTTDEAIEHRLIFLDYDKRGSQTDWESKNFGESSAGRHMTRTYWPNGHLRTRTAKKKVDPDTAATSRTYQYFYDLNESLAGMKDLRSSGSSDDRLTTITRDPNGRQLDVNETWANGKDSRFAYDVAGNVLTRRTDGKIQSNGSFGGADAKATTFDYDSLDREFRMEVDPATGSNRVTTTNYWPSSSRELRRKSNGTDERWFFNTRGELARHERQRDGQSAVEDDDINYRYDANGNRDRDERGRYEFNARDQLTLWQKRGNASRNNPDDEAFDGRVTSYDVNGDGSVTRKEVLSTESDTTPTVTTFSYRGERLRWSDQGDIRTFYRYDDFGNVARIVARPRGAGGEFPTIDETSSENSECPGVPANVEATEIYYCYDEFERPRLTKGAGADAEVLDYDGLDRRDTRKVTVGGTTKTRDFSYIGMSELLSREVDDEGAKRFYDYDSDGDRQGQQVTTGSTNRYRAYTKDANGSVLGLEGDDGQVASGSRYEYDPYGDADDTGSLSDEAQDNPFRFEGFYYDSGVQTYDMLARPYRPDVGRFLTQDRYASASQDLLMQADALTQNRYAFGGANPVNNVEFDGHEPAEGSYKNAPNADMYGESSVSPEARRAKKKSDAAETSAVNSGMPPDSVDRNYRDPGQKAVDRAWSDANIKKARRNVQERRARAARQKEIAGCAAQIEGTIADCNHVGVPQGPIVKRLLDAGEWAPYVGTAISGGRCIDHVFSGETGAAVGSCLGAIPGFKYIKRGGELAGDGYKAITRGGKKGDDVARVACSFSGETLVTMADGSKKPIRRIKVGDRVLATNPLTGTQSARRVTHVWIHQDTVIRLNVAGETLVTTEDHPFWNATDQAWQRADSVDRGDRIGTADGRIAKYRRLSGRPRWTTAYNLTVQGVHTYHVGRHGLLVHNVEKCINLPSWKKLEVDMEHIRSGHMPGGSRVSENKGIFHGMTEDQVQLAVRDAYNSGKRVETQIGGDLQKRVRVQGRGGGHDIEMWINLTTKRVETAYPR